MRRGRWRTAAGHSSHRFNGAALVGVRRDRDHFTMALAFHRASTEPHSLECGESSIRPARASSASMLQRSRTRWSAERPNSTAPFQFCVVLQRSRTRWSAESLGLRVGDLAAIIQLQRSRTRWSAESHVRRWRCAQKCGFNGAALVGVRRVGSPMPRGVGSKVSFNGAALVGVRRAFAVRPAAAHVPRFNGAALVGVRRGGGFPLSAGAHHLLQRSRTRWSAERTRTALASISFIELQRSRTRWSAESGGMSAPSGTCSPLQRSRTRWSAESIIQADMEKAPSHASTEPHSLECGESSRESPTGRPPSGFNGAALVGVRRATPPRPRRRRPWSFNGAALVGVRRGRSMAAITLSTMELQRSRTRWSAERRIGTCHLRLGESASTEPHSLECGESAPYSARVASQSLLQRSRTRWSAERPEHQKVMKPGFQASTEPHSLECGETLYNWACQRAESASTEPHSLECGELSRPWMLTPWMTALQRSRTRWSAERRAVRQGWDQYTCFNGAALVGVRRVSVHFHIPGHGWASTEPHSLECGEQHRCSHQDCPGRASTEPHSLECGESKRRALQRSLDELQRSRTRWSAERKPWRAGWRSVFMLQRSRTRWSAERRGRSNKSTASLSLQRSRTRWSAESTEAHPEAAAKLRASTEPHSLECGEAASRERRAAAQASFNGAALVGVRRGDQSMSLLPGLRRLQRSRTRWSAESVARRL